MSATAEYAEQIARNCAWASNALSSLYLGSVVNFLRSLGMPCGPEDCKEVTDRIQSAVLSELEAFAKQTKGARE